MMLTTILALALSTLCIAALCLGDPKRIRAARIGRPGHGTALRRMLGLAACLPGLLLAFSGDAPAFLIWLGGCAVIGWALAVGFNQGRQDAPAPE